MRTASASALLSGVVDYAGLFPPAALTMADAVAEYRAAAAGDDAWMLGRFVVPAARLDELAAALAEHRGQPSTPVANGAWRVSAIVRDGELADAEAVQRFNDATGAHGARVDSIEGKPTAIEHVDWLACTFPKTFEIYVEVAPGPHVRSWFARLAVHGLRAKVRTGGVTADAFPSPRALAELLDTAVHHNITLKATAGLHHAVRGSYRLTYAPDSASAPMYGYLNVLLAMTALASGASIAEAEALLQSTDADRLTFTADAVRWGAREFPAALLARVRAGGLVSFGSCSFREPAGEFVALAAR